MRIPAPVAFAISAALHGAAVLAMARLPPPVRAENVPVELFEVPPPPEPPAPEPEAPPPTPPAPEPPAPVARPVRRAPEPPPPRRAPPPPPDVAAAPPPDAPPPPNQPPPLDAPSTARAPVKVGIAMSSSTVGGTLPAPTGNTLYGAMPRQAPAPEEAKPYAAERYVPPTQVSVLPRPIGTCELPSEDYPEGALRLGLEGRVVLLITVDEKGGIAAARVVEDPGHGFGDAAIRSVRRRCRFEPGRRGSEPVATTIRYTVVFEQR